MCATSATAPIGPDWTCLTAGGAQGCALKFVRSIFRRASDRIRTRDILITREMREMCDPTYQLLPSVQTHRFRLGGAPGVRTVLRGTRAGNSDPEARGEFTSVGAGRRAMPVYSRRASSISTIRVTAWDRTKFFHWKIHRDSDLVCTPLSPTRRRRRLDLLPNCSGSTRPLRYSPRRRHRTHGLHRAASCRDPCSSVRAAKCCQGSPLVTPSSGTPSAVTPLVQWVCHREEHT
ncbi:MAG: hypothetical protein JWQ77_3215 [Jatrophihabitans sp.]|nr:hypothetical protein [Jatrophihabitans sp.]